MRLTAGSLHNESAAVRPTGAVTLLDLPIPSRISANDSLSAPVPLCRIYPMRAPAPSALRWMLRSTLSPSETTSVHQRGRQSFLKHSGPCQSRSPAGAREASRPAESAYPTIGAMKDRCGPGEMQAARLSPLNKNEFRRFPLREIQLDTGLHQVRTAGDGGGARAILERQSVLCIGGKPLEL
jgi:hypothetical protein